MNRLPKEAVTFFFADIEDSTQLIKRLGEGYPYVLEKYHQTIRHTLDKLQGKEVDTAGDGFFAVFSSPAMAIHSAVMAQWAFYSQPWARKAGLKVRIGIHSGEAVAASTGYIGLEVHRASRVCNAAHGGQVLLSQATIQQLKERFNEGSLTFEDLGEFILRGFEQPERLYQLDIPGIPSNFPPPRTETPSPTVAVLPFANLSGSPEQDYFGDGMAEEIIIALNKVPGLRVVARSSSFAFKGQNLNIRELGEQLGAKAILAGSVQKHDGHIRVLAELVDSETGYNLWAGKFERELSDLFAVQDEIAQNIATALKIKLISKRVRNIKSRHSSDIQAYDRYLQGRQYFYQFSPESIQKALQLFREAVKQDDSYALAYCGLANCFAYLFMYIDNAEEYLLAAGSASRRAIELDPLLSEAFVAYGHYLSLENRFEEAERAFQQALELDPKLFEARYLFARLFYAQGKLEKAAYWFEEANRVRPEDYQSLLLAGHVYAGLGKKEKAMAAQQRGLDVAESSLLLDPGDIRALYLGANGLASMGEKGKALEWLERALALQPHDPMLLYNAGCVYAILGMTTEALSCLEQAYEEGITQRGWYANDSNLDSLRAHPRFQALLGKMSSN
ncbi:MAG: tetratricopeptide repeat protein [Phaeodactylibacter sp.]|nr:tetratricopeptide repeat protein [Phaeodactylibacter sp.]MCB9272913.1 tetratricopeptide repeat protein [Lewinellaceae bacterium]